MKGVKKMDIDMLFFIFLLIVLVGVFTYQMAFIFYIKIYEKKPTSIYITHCVISLFFLMIGIYFGTEIIHYLTTIIISLIFLVSPFTTGLTKNKVIYEPNLTGLSRMAPKKQPYSNINKISAEKENNILNLNILFKNKKVVKMTFNIDKEEIIKEIIM